MASSLSLAGRRAGASALHLPPLGGLDGMQPRFHPAPSRNEVAVVQPVLVRNCLPSYRGLWSFCFDSQIKYLEADLLSDLIFLPRGVLSTAKTGLTKLWIRPLVLRTKNLDKGRRQSFSEAQDVI